MAQRTTETVTPKNCSLRNKSIANGLPSSEFRNSHCKGMLTSPTQFLFNFTKFGIYLDNFLLPHNFSHRKKTDHLLFPSLTINKRNTLFKRFCFVQRSKLKLGIDMCTLQKYNK